MHMTDDLRLTLILGQHAAIQALNKTVSVCSRRETRREAKLEPDTIQICFYYLNEKRFRLRRAKITET